MHAKQQRQELKSRSSSNGSRAQGSNAGGSGGKVAGKISSLALTSMNNSSWWSEGEPKRACVCVPQLQTPRVRSIVEITKHVR